MIHNTSWPRKHNIQFFFVFHDMNISAGPTLDPVWHVATPHSSIYRQWTLLLRSPNTNRKCHIHYNGHTSPQGTYYNEYVFNSMQAYVVSSIITQLPQFVINKFNTTPNSCGIKYEKSSMLKKYSHRYLKGHCIEFGVVWIDSTIVAWKWCE